MTIGLVYQIYSPRKNLRYIGSTFLSLNQRKNRHISHYKRIIAGKANNYTAKKVMDGLDVIFSTIEQYPNIDKKDLGMKEKEVILKLKEVHGDKIVNHNIGLTNDMKQYQKNYREDEEHKLKKKEYMKNYRLKYPEKFRNYTKKYYEKKINQS